MAREGGWGGTLVVSLSYDTLGTLAAVRPYASDLPTERVTALQDALPDLLQSVGPDGPRRVRLVISTGPPLVLRTEPAEECMPMLRNRTEISRLLQRTGAGRGVGGVAADVRVGTDGSPLTVRLEGSSGDPHIDTVLSGAAERMRFHPALIDGYPVALWARIPLTLRRAR